MVRHTDGQAPDGQATRARRGTAKKKAPAKRAVTKKKAAAQKAPAKRTATKKKAPRRRVRPENGGDLGRLLSGTNLERGLERGQLCLES